MSIWYNDEEPGYNKGKSNTSFTKWRVLTMERLAVLAEISEEEAAGRLQSRTLAQLGRDYENGITAEQLAQILSQ